MKTLKLTLITLAVSALFGCSTIRPLGTVEISDQPTVATIQAKEFNNVPAPSGPPIAVAVYSFKDLTGQRKNSTTLSLFSTAVTQGAEAYLIKSLQEIGNRQWFTVVERANLDNLLKERQMIKQTREIYEGNAAKPLPPMTMAGVIIEGGIIDYNSNVLTGGTGVAVFGIGPYTQYTQDQVVISLRLVSVQTGEILTTVTVQKNLLSTQDGITALKFFNQNTDSFEFDSSQSFNEPGNYALRSAIEQGIVELIKKGERQGLWKYKEAMPVVPELPKEEKKDSKPVSQIVPPTIEKTHDTAFNTKSGTIKDWVNLRATKDYSSKKLALVGPGTVVAVVKDDVSHYLINHNNTEGWVSKQFVVFNENDNKG
jgi:curli production assembly/transport component CsgG